MNPEEVLEELQKRIDRDAMLSQIRGRIESGKATDLDSARYCIRSGTVAGKYLGSQILDVPSDAREALCVDVLHGRYKDAVKQCAAVQEAQDAKQGLHLAPQIPAFNSERAHKIGRATADPTAPDETIRRRADAPIANATASVHDDFVRKQADFRSGAGLSCQITRDSGSGCCPWCAEIAGRYAYGSEPKDIYARHDNCGCTVTFESGRKRSGGRSGRQTEHPAPDAGAGEPVRFTAENRPRGAVAPVRVSAEQAREIAEKRRAKRFARRQNDLTSGVSHDILESIELFSGSDQMTEAQRKTLDDALAPIPDRLLAELAKFVKSIQIESGREFSSFNRSTKDIILDKETAGETVVHELGHAFGDMLKLYDDPEFLAILSSGLNLADWGEVVPYPHPVHENETVNIYSGNGASKFLSPYQGRIYGDVGDWRNPIDPRQFLEYISVGFDSYFHSPDELKSKDPALYHFLEGKIHGYTDSGT